MTDTPEINLTTENNPKMELTTPYNTVNKLYELVSNKITDMDMPDMPPEAYPTVDAVSKFVYHKTDYLSQMSNAAIQLANQNAIQIGDQEHRLDTKESLSNKVTTFEDNINNEKYPSTGAVFEFGMNIQNSCYSFTNNVINDRIGNIENALDTIIDLQNQYTGGDSVWIYLRN